MENYLNKTFSVRVCKKDGTAKLVGGVTGIVAVGRVGAKIIAPPNAPGDPWKATEVLRVIQSDQAPEPLRKRSL